MFLKTKQEKPNILKKKIVHADNSNKLCISKIRRNSRISIATENKISHTTFAI